jgi:putative transposase
MRKAKFSETQIVGILKDAESGVPVPDLVRKLRHFRRETCA